ncbi:MAG: NADP oxidoreductase [Streptococcus mitis]|nr:NADP oxidoreductase [Streptococcus mitis]MDU3713154.1 NADP oxidoreductase [Streptococcus mitis]
MAVYYDRLGDIMTKILKTAKTTTETYGLCTDYLEGENIVDF